MAARRRRVWRTPPALLNWPSVLAGAVAGPAVQLGLLSAPVQVRTVLWDGSQFLQLVTRSLASEVREERGLQSVLSHPQSTSCFSSQWPVPPGGGTFTAPTLRGAFTPDTQGGPASLIELHPIQVQRSCHTAHKSLKAA